MTTKHFFALLLSIVLSCFAVSCSRGPAELGAQSQSSPTTSPGKKITSTSVVKITAPPAELAAGASAETDVNLAIQEGYHVNANPPTFAYLKATELEVPTSEGVSVSSIKYPDALTRKFAFADEPLAVYEGNTSLKVQLKADPSAPKGERHLSGKLRIQACDEEVCYPPGTIDVTIPVRVK